ncbi:MAG: PilZ domain-containing protein [Sphingomonas sp.]|nr:PilZ domain-containing protein [Sphingomonas sp.]
MGVESWTNELLSVIGLADDDEAPRPERRRSEERHDFAGHKIVLRQRRSLGILHLKDISAHGACGITDMPLAVGSMVFLGLSKPHFRAAEVLWCRRLTVGLRWLRPVRAEQLDKLHGAHVAARADRENWGIRPDSSLANRS